jgi:hypothetical protein
VDFCFNDVDRRSGAEAAGAAGLLALIVLAGRGFGAVPGDLVLVAGGAVGRIGSRLGETLRDGSCWRSLACRSGTVDVGLRSDRARVKEDIVATPTAGCNLGRSETGGYRDGVVLCRGTYITPRDASTSETNTTMTAFI